MKKSISLQELAPYFLKQLPQGIFLTVSDGEQKNSMTIAWATIGHIWNKPVATIYVRPQRHTHSILENANDFTLNIPVHTSLKKELAICGTKSGKDIDKYETCNLHPEPSLSVFSPSLKECELNIECRILYRQTMHGENDPTVEKHYPNKDYHQILYGEIIAAYYNE